MFAPAVVAAGLIWGAEAVPIAATIVAALLLPVIGYSIERVVGVTLAEMAEAMWRPAVAAVFMAGMVAFVHHGELIPAVRLLLEIVLGAGAYGVALIALWVVAGRPEGAESALYSMWRRKRGMVPM